MILSGIIFVLRNGLRWRDAPREYGPHKTIYNRFIRWSRLGVFNRILAELTAKRGKPEQLMIDATHLKAHRTAASLLKKGDVPRRIGRTVDSLVGSQISHHSEAYASPVQIRRFSPAPGED
ncbi:Transposase orfA IS5 family element [Neorhizobium galegae bv. orientalis]|nr:IS5 family transposase [Neorhizobium galegae]CDZ60065.1 Transposase orfA IS5 family element [Neorhizobium galegae bv. orientalis]CDZ64787.1 Transposase orfA IS5 family element [Neorhizobium galegae bv. orientalis]